MTPQARHQHGSALFLVLIVLATLLLSGLSLARMTDAGTLLAGNIANRDAALQAAEIGVNTGYADVRTLASEASDIANWYHGSLVATQSAQGLPDVDWSKAPSQAVGGFTVSYVVERACDNTAEVTDPARQCLLKEVDMPANRGEDPGDRDKQLDNPYATQFRITARVTDPRSTTVFVQSLVTKGSN